MIAEASEIPDSLRISLRRKRKTMHCFKISLPSDGVASDNACSKDINEDAFLWRIKEKETDRNHYKNSTGCQPFYSTKWECEKFKLTGAFQMSVMFLLIITMFEVGSLQVHGFSSFKIGSGSTRLQRITVQEFSTREQNYQQTKKITRSRNNDNFASELFSTSHTAEQEALISLKWMEYFSPETQVNSTSKRNQQHTPVLFLHGLLGSKRNFATCAQMLAVQLEKKRRILGVDLRNHGDTQPWSDESK